MALKLIKYSVMKACGEVEVLLQALLNSAVHWGELHALATSPPVKKDPAQMA